ncbi:alcohol dehydrogenase catalytic domain-containing protein [Paenibacillus sp.]|jgi:2-desacetyl-2-hydroxyethyl bacteriochlorophyllide A dehydrogenase|uniref:alcohol dehydrogenase catalytic domain-containing protein n=1 Tax=Paenibacillus sp. TaxID=58172 RepID=UPI00281FAE43|nr:alcohol dehydrogenase catalytic domain-containing protein [Paenibacillus sp.]MDR0267482.1 alcohol dehydrogenase catalytic domain-containing protein [Paenibacillus sp.]
MKAVVWREAKTVEVTDMPEPSIIAPTDAVVKVTLTAICGTDLHPYRGHFADFPEGTILGHEFTGIVEAVGSEVVNLKPGDRVVASDVIACGQCWFCQLGFHYQCQDVSLFGYGEVVGSYTPGAQSEKVRVPHADVVLLPIPDELSDEDVLFVGDILATGYACSKESHIQEGDTVVVIGGGPVGLMAVMCAQLYAPATIYVIEPNEHRHAIAREIGAIPLKPEETQRIHKHTQGRGADIVLEAVGVDATLQQALLLVRPKGNITCVGAHSSREMPFDAEQAFAKEITLRFVVGDPIRYGKELLALIQAGKLAPKRIISHRMRLDEAVEGYHQFDRQQALKIVLAP